MESQPYILYPTHSIKHKNQLIFPKKLLNVIERNKYNFDKLVKDMLNLL